MSSVTGGIVITVTEMSVQHSSDPSLRHTARSHTCKGSVQPRWGIFICTKDRSGTGAGHT